MDGFLEAVDNVIEAHDHKADLKELSLLDPEDFGNW
jgi:hypothetical protein